MPPLLGRLENPRIDEGTVCTLLRDGLECPNTETNADELLQFRYPDPFVLQVHLEATLGQSGDLGTHSTEVLGFTSGGLAVSGSSSGSSDLASTRHLLGPVLCPGSLRCTRSVHGFQPSPDRFGALFTIASKEGTDVPPNGQPNRKPGLALHPPMKTLLRPSTDPQRVSSRKRHEIEEAPKPDNPRNHNSCN